MKKKIFDTLKSKYTQVGVSDKAFDRVASYLEKMVTAESSEEDLNKVIEGAETLLIGMKAESDSKLEDFKKKNNSYQTEEAEKKDTDEKKSEKKDASETSELSDIAKLITDALKPLAEEISGLKTQKQQETLNEKLVKTLEEKKVPKTYYANAVINRQFKDDAEVDELVATLEEGYSDLKKEFGQEGLGQMGRPVIGGAPVKEGELTPSEQKYIDNLKPKEQ